MPISSGRMYGKQQSSVTMLAANSFWVPLMRMVDILHNDRDGYENRYTINNDGVATRLVLPCSFRRCTTPMIGPTTEGFVAFLTLLQGLALPLLSVCYALATHVSL